MTTDTKFQTWSRTLVESVFSLCVCCWAKCCLRGGEMLSAARINQARCSSCQPCVLHAWNWVLSSGTSAEDWPAAVVLAAALWASVLPLSSPSECVPVIIPNYLTCLVLDSQRIVIKRHYSWQSCIKICIFTLVLENFRSNCVITAESMNAPPTVSWSDA